MTHLACSDALRLEHLSLLACTQELYIVFQILSLWYHLPVILKHIFYFPPYNSMFYISLFNIHKGCLVWSHLRLQKLAQFLLFLDQEVKVAMRILSSPSLRWFLSSDQPNGFGIPFLLIFDVFVPDLCREPFYGQQKPNPSL